MPSSKLKPCPFCGSAPTFDRGWSSGAWFVACFNLKCHVNPITDARKTKRGAINAWNKRKGADHA